MALKKGTPVVVKTGEGYINESAKATVAADQVEGSIWVQVTWDEPKGDRVNGEYLANSFDVVEPEKVDIAEAIAALVDKTTEEAFARGKAEGEKSQKVLDDVTKSELREAFSELTVKSNAVYNLLSKNGIV